MHFKLSSGVLLTRKSLLKGAKELILSLEIVSIELCITTSEGDLGSQDC